MDDLVKRLREYTAMRYMGDCKCGNCRLVPRPTVDEAADRIEQLNLDIVGLKIKITQLEAALRKVLNDVARSDYPDQMAFDWLDEARAALGEMKDGN